MRMICLETTDSRGSIALLDAGRLIDERLLRGPQRTAQSFAPAMQELIAAAGWTFRDLQRVAVAAGPGSFTGLRIGVTAAKTLAYLLGAELLGVNTLAAIAWRYFHNEDAAPPAGQKLWCVLDAQRGQVFAARFIADASSPQQFKILEETQVLEVAAWRSRLQPGDAVSGPVLAKLADELPPEIIVANASLWSPTAAAVGMLAEIEFTTSRRDDPFQLVPNYYRLSAAEEKRAAQDAKNGT